MQHANYTDINDLLGDLRRALKVHPTEKPTLKAIADLAERDGLEAGIAAFADWQNTIAGGGKAESPQPAAPESAQTGNDAPDDALHTDAGQGASGGITGQSTLPGEADTGALPAAKPDVASLPSGASHSTPAHANQPDSPTRTDAGQEAAGSAMTQGVQPGKANGQPDNALVRLREQIEGCLGMETDPIRRVFLERLQQDCLACPIDALRQKLEVYLQPGSLGDFLSRLAALQLRRALDDANDDFDGGRLERGDAKDRGAVLRRAKAAFEQEADAVLRLRLATIACQAVTDPLGARNEMTGYDYGRTDWEWVWFITIGVLGGAENAFRWRLQEVRRQVQAKDAWLLDCLDKAEQTARKNLSRAVSNLEALASVAAALDGQAEAAQNAPGNLAAGLPAAVA